MSLYIFILISIFNENFANITSSHCNSLWPVYHSDSVSDSVSDSSLWLDLFIWSISFSPRPVEADGRPPESSSAPGFCPCTAEGQGENPRLCCFMLLWADRLASLWLSKALRVAFQNKSMYTCIYIYIHIYNYIYMYSMSIKGQTRKKLNCF